MMEQITVVLVDDQAHFREGLQALMLAAPDLAIIGEAANGDEAIALAAALQPDVILMDINMPVMDGLTATRLIRQQHPHIRVIVLTASILEADTLTASEVGASAYLRKDASTAEIESAIRGDAPQ
jgi:DNA-binding NarL/FixJ family response regulator